MNKNNLYKSIVSGISVVAIMSSMLTLWIPDQRSEFASADWSKNKDNTRLDTSKIIDPVAPSDKDAAWQGNYVYFGNYGKEPIKFRVLDPCTTWGTGMFLDSDKVLFDYVFDTNDKKWDYSDLRRYLNTIFLNEALNDKDLQCVGSGSQNDNVTERLFLLDQEVLKPQYGYSSNSGKTEKNKTYDPHSDFENGGKKTNGSTTVRVTEIEPVQNHIKSFAGTSSNWWLSSASYIATDGHKDDNLKKNVTAGVAPALFLNTKKVLFSTLVAGVQEKTGAEYKLTMLDKNLEISVQSGKKPSAIGNTVTIPYEIKGDDASIADHVSILITNDYYQIGNPNEADILYYGSLDNTFSPKNGMFNLVGEGTITLPSSFKVNDWGYKYLVYLIAEDVNGTKYTDYASMPIELADVVINGRSGVADDKNNNSSTSNDPASSGSSSKSATPGGSASVPAANPTSKPKITYTGTIELNRSQSDVICGKTLSLKTTGKESSAKITWESSNKNIATVDSNGVVTGKKAGTVTISAISGSKIGTCKVTVLYKDVTDYSAFWFEPTNYLTAKGVVQGYEKQTKFKPGNYCTRAQMVTFIWRLEGQPSPKSNTCKFSDVKSSDYFYKACIWGNEKHIVEGYKDGTFKPQKTCERKHAVTFLWRLAGSPEPKSSNNRFSDVRRSDYYHKATLWASEKKILAGYSDGTFRPDGDCLRRQMVTFLYKYDKYINGK